MYFHNAPGWISHILSNYSILPVITLNSIIYSKTIQGSFNGVTFKAWLEGLLEEMNPYLEPKSVLVVDNCGTHHVEGVQEMYSEK